MPKKVTTAEFIERAKKVHGDRYDYSITEYVNSGTKVSINCREHGEFEQLPSNHVSRRAGCPRCANNAPVTESEFIRKAEEIHGSKYDYSNVVIVNQNTKIKIICPVHGEFEQTPSRHISGAGCTKCGWDNLRKTKAFSMDEFIRKSKDIHGDLYDYRQVNYVNNRTPVTIICAIHGAFQQRPDVHLNGGGCIKCGYHSLSKYKTKTQEQFIADARSKHGDFYDYSKVEYEHGEKNVVIVCPIHGEFLQRPQNHILGNGCPMCAGNRQLTTEEFVERARKVHGDKYDYKEVDYQKTHKPISIICPKHGGFQQLPLNHLRGHGCPKCHHARLSIDFRMSSEEFIEKAKRAHGNKYDYSRVEYLNSKTPVTIICPEHGEFKQNPSNHTKGIGCSACADYGFNPKLPAILYYLRVENRISIFYKIGITNRTVKERFPPRDMAMISVLKTWAYDVGQEAYEREQEILREYDSERYYGPEVPLSSGNTELFTVDILSLGMSSVD